MAQSALREALVPMAALLIGIAGCGYGAKSRVPVQGKVVFQGAPVDDGVITFVPTTGEGTKAGGPIKDGKYSLPAGEGPTPGTYRVEITWNKKTGKMIGTPGDADVKMAETAQVIPTQYNSNSTLTADIKAQANTVDFDLK
jgi:hypothetical protein